MKNKLLVLTLALCLIGTNSMAQEVVKGLDEKKDLTTLNRILRRSARRLNAIENGVSLTSGVKGILPLLNGGTGAALADPGADRIYFWDESGNITNFLTVGSGLDLIGTTLTATTPNTSNVIFSWSGVDNVVNGSQGAFVNAAPDIGANTAEFMVVGRDETTYGTLLNFRFKKIAGISTVTIESRMAVSANTGSCKVDIGGQNNTVTTVSTSYGWATAADINVSGLSDGTTYDGIIQLKNSNANSDTFLSAITLIGS